MGQMPVAIVLGGIFPHAEVLRKLRKRGYYTILIDYFDNPVAAAEADEHSNESALDYDAVLKIAGGRNASLILSPCLDQQMVIAMQVSEKLGLPHPFSSETALKVTNKKLMKELMMKNGISTARYYQVGRNTDPAVLDLEYPVIVKPTDSCGAAGVRRLEDPSALKEAVDFACGWSRTGEAVVEEFKTGVEVSAYTIIKDHKAVLITTQRRISIVDDRTVKCYAAVNPAGISEKIRERLEDLATSLAAAFDLDNTPLFFQAVISGDDIYVIEFSPRIGGGMCYKTMELNAGYDILEASIDSYLQKEVPYPMPKREHTTYLVHQILGVDGIFDHLEGHEELIDKGLITELFFHKTKGMRVSTEKASSARVAVILMEVKQGEDATQKLKDIMSKIRVIDPQGCDIMDRSLLFKLDT